jgi:hypothetical protein
MTRALAIATFALAVIRYGCRRVIAISDEIDDALSTYLVEVPEYVPESMTVDPL